MVLTIQKICICVLDKFILSSLIISVSCNLVVIGMGREFPK